MNFERLAVHRGEILWWEICCLLHDIGKLSDEFLVYRQNWHRMKKGYSEKDPHDHEWLKRDHLLGEKEFEGLKLFFKTEINYTFRVKTAEEAHGTLSVENAVHHHIGGEDADDLTGFLKKGDKLDSEYDRNNPLIGCEQTNHQDENASPELYRSNVFGYEGEPKRVYRGRFVWPKGFDQEPKRESEGILTRARRELYRELWRVLEGVKPEQLAWDDYDKLRNLMRRYFEPAMSDTTRPNNDTSLWEHVYSVASIAKVLHIERLLGEQGKPDEMFRIWGFGFDSLRFLAPSHKIGDLLGRRKVLQWIFEKARRFIEYEIPIGNRVYQDDNFSLYVAPPLDEAGFQQVKEKLSEKVIQLSVEESRGELLPRFTFGGKERALTTIVERIQDLRNKVAVPVAEGGQLRARRIQDEWPAKSANRSICAVCQTRPTRKEEENKLLCGECLCRRQNHTEGFTLDETTYQTPFVDEIADKNGRVALIVAKFGLREWLDGRMVRTTFITQSDAIKRMRKALTHIKEASLQADLDERKKWFGKRGQNDYQQMRREVEQCLVGENTDALFLYGRSLKGNPPTLNRSWVEAKEGWWQTRQAAWREHPFLERREDGALLLNLICGKTPTPSTVLDVWETTNQFLGGIGGKRAGFGLSGGEEVIVARPSVLEEMGLEARPRWYVELDGLPESLQPNKHETFAAEIRGKRIEVVYEQSGTRFWLVKDPAEETWAGSVVRLERDNGKEFEGHVQKVGRKPAAYYPYRVIMDSPELLLLLVPAEQALEVTEVIYSRYLEEFGKAYGRLPLSIGNVFFPKYLPMFSALDAARRMETAFRRLQEDAPWIRRLLPVAARDLGLRLGKQDGDADWYHPYIRTAEELKNCPSYFETLIGPVARIEDLGEDTEVLLRPNFYHWEFLGASADRFRVRLEERWKGQREMRWMDFSKETKLGEERTGGPLLLEDVLRTETKGSVASIWKTLRDSGISDASVRNLEQTLARRLASWEKAAGGRGRQAVVGLAASLVAKYFELEEHRRIILQGIESGRFFTTLDLYVRVLKKRLKKRGEGDGDSNSRTQPLHTANVSR